jgi:hypothetical protein
MDNTGYRYIVRKGPTVFQVKELCEECRFELVVSKGSYGRLRIGLEGSRVVRHEVHKENA